MTNRRKVRQAQGARPPVILALSGGMFTDADDFDVEPLGSTVEVMDFPAVPGALPTLLRREFTMSGVLCAPECPWDAVLGLPRIGVFDADELVIYLSPNFDGRLPSTLDALEQRKADQNGVATRSGDRLVMVDLDFPQPS